MSGAQHGCPASLHLILPFPTVPLSLPSLLLPLYPFVLCPIVLLQSPLDMHHRPHSSFRLNRIEAALPQPRHLPPQAV